MYRIMPERYRKWVEEMMRYTGSTKDPKYFVNYTFVMSFGVGFVAGIIVRDYFLLIWPAVTVSLFALFHGFLVLAVDKRTKYVETILPDALQLMAANSRAGYIPSRALLLSARKEFGPLSEAIRRVGKEILTGKPLEYALNEIRMYIKSELLDRTIRFIIEGTKGGGQFAALLEENADDIRRIHALKKEVKANIVMYTIFIGFAGCVGAPILYALSSFLVNTISKFRGLSEIPETTTFQVPLMKFGGFELSENFLFMFSIVAILLTTVFGGLIIGLITSGKEKAGIRYIPMLVVTSFAIFFLVNMVIKSMFGTILQS